MGLPAAWLAMLATAALASSRIAGIVLTAPFPGNHVPRAVKVGLVVLLSLLVASIVPPAPGVGLDLRLLGFATTEIAVGLLVGFTFRLTFACAEVMGGTFSQSLGLTFGHVFDPTLGSDDAVPGRIATILGMLLVLALGAHRVAIAYVLQSFHVLPIGGPVSIAGATPLLVDWGGAAIAAGVRLALPVAAVAFAVQVTLALVARAAPSLQIFNVGLAVTVGAGVLAVIASLDDVTAGLGAELAKTGPRIDELLQVLHVGPGP